LITNLTTTYVPTKLASKQLFSNGSGGLAATQKTSPERAVEVVKPAEVDKSVEAAEHFEEPRAAVL
jgi:hypothetical protein